MKKWMKKLTAALLIMFLALSFASGNNEVKAADELEIFVDEMINIYVPGEIVYLKFVAPNNGRYSFESFASSDTYGYLFDSNKEQLTSNDDSGSNYRQFCVNYELEKGVTYYWGARFYTSGDTGNFDVKVTCTEVYSQIFNDQ